MASEATFGDLSQDPLSRLVNAEIEQAFLGACLMNNGAFVRSAGMLVPEDFGYAVHGKIYEAIGKLIDRGHTASAVTLKDMLAADLAESGGAGYLGKLIAGAVIVSNAPHYAESIADFSRRRKLIEACNDTIADAATIDIERSAMAVIADHEQRIFEIGQQRDGGSGAVTIGAALDEAMSASEAAYKAGGRIAGVGTGLVDLDRLIGGLAPGNLEVVAGRPSMGKSSLAGGIAIHAARRLGVPSAIFSLEETAAQQAQRILAAHSGVAAERQRRGDLDMVSFDSMIRSTAELRGDPLLIDETPGLSISEIRRRARVLKQRRGIGLVVIDHLQLVTVGGRVESRRVEVGIITRALKQLAKELALPVLLLSQLSRAVEQRDNKRPQLADLRETGDIEADADGVFFVYRPEYYLAREEPTRRPEENDEKFNDRYERWSKALGASQGIAEIIVAKRRGGPIGTVRVHWNPTLTRFDNLAHQGAF